MTPEQHEIARMAADVAGRVAISRARYTGQPLPSTAAADVTAAYLAALTALAAPKPAPQEN